MKYSYQKGYTLLFAVIIASMVLGVAVFILSVSKKQYALAIVARDSMYAFYAADSGIECMSLVEATSTVNTTVNCGGESVTINSTDFVNTVSYPGFHNSPNPKSLNAQKVIPLGEGRCATIMIIIGKDAATPTENKTVIESRGYNQCKADDTGPVQSTRTVERALRLTQY